MGFVLNAAHHMSTSTAAARVAAAFQGDLGAVTRFVLEPVMGRREVSFDAFAPLACAALTKLQAKEPGVLQQWLSRVVAQLPGAPEAARRWSVARMKAFDWVQVAAVLYAAFIARPPCVDQDYVYLTTMEYPDKSQFCRPSFPLHAEGAHRPAVAAEYTCRTFARGRPPKLPRRGRPARRGGPGDGPGGGLGTGAGVGAGAGAGAHDAAQRADYARILREEAERDAARELEAQFAGLRVPSAEAAPAEAAREAVAIPELTGGVLHLQRRRKRRLGIPQGTRW